MTPTPQRDAAASSAWDAPRERGSKRVVAKGLVMTSASDLSDIQVRFRDVMTSVCTPVSVVTAMTDGQPYGTTVSAFASLSMDPPMVLVALDRGSDLLTVIQATGSFGLNILNSSQPATALIFARKGGPSKFDGVPWVLEGGLPRIGGSGGFLACRVDALIEGGDHIVVFGEVLQADTVAAPPLTYHGRAFGTHAAHATAD
ncbi:MULTISPECIES: flavin reductase family protein [unclassified Streptomyces]|uniref:flavin reductase family protein n=1 Tax=unclassified Streptomyces TaxID=2593676 RepID=UPI0036F08A77